MTNRPIVQRMEWRLHELMGRHHIRTATKLRELLHHHGVDISSAQLSRLMNAPPKRMSADLAYALTRIFNCQMNELWHNPEVEVAQPKSRRKGSVAGNSEQSAPAPARTLYPEAGPRVRPFPEKLTK